MPKCLLQLPITVTKWWRQSTYKEERPIIVFGALVHSQLVLLLPDLR